MRSHGTGRVLDAEYSREGVESVKINLEQLGTSFSQLERGVRSVGQPHWYDGHHGIREGFAAKAI